MAKKKRKPKKALVESDETYMTWLVEARTHIQRMLLHLFNLTKLFPGIAKKHDDLIFLDLAVGAAFSLWRAVFLGDTPRDLSSRLDALKKFLDKAIMDNAVLYPDEKANRAWVVGYYLTNAKLRVLALASIEPKQNTAQYKRYMLRLSLEGGSRDAETRAEWEWAFMALQLALHLRFNGQFENPDPEDDIDPDDSRKGLLERWMEGEFDDD
jgi:hypothetical protein